MLSVAEFPLSHSFDFFYTGTGENNDMGYSIVVKTVGILPPWVVLDPWLKQWLAEDIGRGDRTTQSLFAQTAIPAGQATWVAKQAGVIAGLPLVERLFFLLDPQTQVQFLVEEGSWCESGTAIAQLQGNLDTLLTGERVALNTAMYLSGIATETRQYVDAIQDFPAQLVDTRKTTPGLRIFDKYATQLGGAQNHRMGLDDAVMVKDNHIAVAGSISEAIARLRATIPYPLTIEVETETLAQVKEAIQHKADIIMLDNMRMADMKQAIAIIRQAQPAVSEVEPRPIKIEASGNITIDNIRDVAATGVDYISTSALVTKASWLDLSMAIG